MGLVAFFCSAGSPAEAQNRDAPRAYVNAKQVETLDDAVARLGLASDAPDCELLRGIAQFLSDRGDRAEWLRRRGCEAAPVTMVPGVSIRESDGSTTVSEDGLQSDTYTVVLDAQPTADVTIAVTPDGQAMADPGTLLFTSESWNTPQTVTTIAVDDMVAEGDHVATIMHSAESDDANYDGIDVVGVAVNVTDNDVVGVAIRQTDESTSVAEGGATDTYAIVLLTEPTADVAITVTPDSQVSVSPTSLTFTSDNWNEPQIVSVSATDDAAVERGHASTLVHAVTSGDDAYNDLVVDALVVSVADNDSSGVRITESDGSTDVAEGGTMDTYAVVLLSHPTADVTIMVRPDGQTIVGPRQLMFTPDNWSAAQTVTVKAREDARVEGPHTATISHTASSDDPSYGGIAIASVTVSITDTPVPEQTPVEKVLAEFPEKTDELSAAVCGRFWSQGVPLRAMRSRRETLNQAPAELKAAYVMRELSRQGANPAELTVRVAGYYHQEIVDARMELERDSSDELHLLACDTTAALLQHLSGLNVSSTSADYAAWTATFAEAQWWRWEMVCRLLANATGGSVEGDAEVAGYAAQVRTGIVSKQGSRVERGCAEPERWATELDEGETYPSWLAPRSETPALQTPNINALTAKQLYSEGDGGAGVWSVFERVQTAKAAAAGVALKDSASMDELVDLFQVETGAVRSVAVDLFLEIYRHPTGDYVGFWCSRKPGDIESGTSEVLERYAYRTDELSDLIQKAKGTTATRDKLIIAIDTGVRGPDVMGLCDAFGVSLDAPRAAMPDRFVFFTTSAAALLKGTRESASPGAVAERPSDRWTWDAVYRFLWNAGCYRWGESDTSEVVPSLGQAKRSRVWFCDGVDCGDAKDERHGLRYVPHQPDSESAPYIPFLFDKNLPQR